MIDAPTLRLPAIVPMHRERRLRSALIATLERDAQGEKLQLLALWTETAKPSSEQLGYRVIASDYLPDELKRSTRVCSRQLAVSRG